MLILEKNNMSDMGIIDRVMAKYTLINFIELPPPLIDINLSKCPYVVLIHHVFQFQKFYLGQKQLFDSFLSYSSFDVILILVFYFYG